MPSRPSHSLPCRGLMVDDGLELKYVSDEDSAPARRSARRPRNNRGDETSGSGVNRFNLLLETVETVELSVLHYSLSVVNHETVEPEPGIAGRVHPPPDAPGETRVWPGYLPVLKGEPIDDWVPAPTNKTPHTALKALTGREYSKPAVLALLMSRAMAPVAAALERAVYTDVSGELLPTQGKAKKEQFKANFHALGVRQAKSLRWRLVFNTEKPIVEGGPLTHDEWVQMGKDIFGDLPPEDLNTDDVGPEPSE
ncbi:hypothetical protein ACK3TF_002794 [Chlorella vulgaris]